MPFCFLINTGIKSKQGRTLRRACCDNWGGFSFDFSPVWDFDSAERLQYPNLPCLGVQRSIMACRFELLALFMTHRRDGSWRCC